MVVERVEVHVRAETERGEVVISWRGGVTTRHEIIRTVSRYESLGRYDQLMNRIIEMRQEGRTIKQIAAQLNAEGYRTPRSRKGYTSTSVRKLLSRGELTRGRIATRQLDRHEWWLPDLARELQMSANKLRDWALRGWVRSRQVPPRGLWIIWADGRERQRLRKLRAASKRGKRCGRSTVPQEGHPLMILDPIDPRGAGRWDRGFVTKEALCRADPDLWGAWGSNPPGRPGPSSSCPLRVPSDRASNFLEFSKSGIVNKLHASIEYNLKSHALGGLEGRGPQHSTRRQAFPGCGKFTRDGPRDATLTLIREVREGGGDDRRRSDGCRRRR